MSNGDNYLWMESGIYLSTVAIIILFVRIRVVYDSIQKSRNNCCDARSEKNAKGEITAVRKRPVSMLVVLGSGGHTSEMLSIIDKINHSKYDPIVYLVARTDSTSERRLNKSHTKKSSLVYYIPRSREVGQSYFTSIFTTLWSFIYVFIVTFRIKPSVLVCNGPGTCIPVVLNVLILRVLGLCDGKVIFVESIARVQRYESSSNVNFFCVNTLMVSHILSKSLSMSGHILYYIVDRFIVYWKELKEKYPRVELMTGNG